MGLAPRSTDRRGSARVGAASVAWLALLVPAGCDRPPAVHGGGPAVRRDAAAEDAVAFGELADFRLVDQDGRAVTRADLLGRPFALACIFTTCTGPCPALGATMARLQRELGDTDVRLVSLSVDPEIDTPEVLAEYARGLGAEPERWTFLTGAGDEIDRLVVKSFYLPLARGAPSAETPLGIHVTHSTELVAVDRAGRIRGYYGVREPAGAAALLARLRFLAEEPAPASALR